MNWFYSLSLEVRLTIIFLLGIAIGAQVNRGVYALAWNRRKIGPWLPKDDKAPPRRWYDYLPVTGWWTLRREANLHGDGFWLRPLTVELMMGAGLTLLYWWEVTGGLLPQAVQSYGLGGPVSLPPLPPSWVHAQFTVHAILIALMAVASLIDIDEKLIPDELTDIGALVGLALAILLPMGRLPDWEAFAHVPPAASWSSSTLLLTTSPSNWSLDFNRLNGLLIGLACFAAWWLAIVPWTWTTRRGCLKAIPLALTSLQRRVWPRPARTGEGSRWFLVILFGGLLVISAVWFLQSMIGVTRWQALLSALIGMAAGGAIVWAVRIIGKHALQQEAMGFGDVTLVAMIGAFLGWQPCLMLFFIAPFIGVAIAVLNYLMTRRTDIWYGPFLCAGAVISIVYWATLWEAYGRPIFGMGLIVPALTIFLFGIMWAMLTIWRFIKVTFIFRGENHNADATR